MTATVLCFGDSNTHGSCAMANFEDRQRLDKNTRWPGILQAALGTAATVIEEGLPGRTTVHDDPIEGAHKNGLSMLMGVLETHRPVDVVIVMLGTNDLKARFSVTAFDIAKSVERLVGVIQASDCGPNGAPQVLVVSPVPIEERGILAEMFQGGAAKSRDLAARLAARVSVPLVDAGMVAEVDPVDGIHLLPEAHAAIGQAIAAAVRPMLAPRA